MAQLNRNFISLLHLAAARANVEIARRLVKAGAKVNIGTGFGWTPLHYADRYRSNEIINLLLEAGANVNATEVTKRTPLHLAVGHDTSWIHDIQSTVALLG